MGRSIAKGPFVAYHLLNRINKMNETNNKDTIDNINVNRSTKS